MDNIIKRLKNMANSTNSCKSITALNHLITLNEIDFSSLPNDEKNEIISFEDKILTQMGF